MKPRGEQAPMGHISWTPLHRASRVGDIEAVKLLLAEGADINAVSSINETPLFLALEHKNVVDLLLEHGASVDAQRFDGWAPVHWAARYGRLEVLNTLLEHGVRVNDSSTDHGTPLSLAVDRPDVMESLLSHGADVNGRVYAAMSRSCTPLHLASERGNRSAVELLLAHGADIHATADEAGFGYSTCGLTALHLAVRNDRKEVVEALLANQADVNRMDKRGSTPLHFAHHEGVICLLLAGGAEIHARNEDLWTPLHSTASWPKGIALQALLASGAEVNAKTNEGWTPFHLAARYGNKEALGLLLAQGATINEPTGSGQTALHLAAAHDKIGVAEWLLANGASANVRSNDGRTPLEVAAPWRYGPFAALFSSSYGGVNDESQ